MLRKIFIAVRDYCRGYRDEDLESMKEKTLLKPLRPGQTAKLTKREFKALLKNPSWWG